MENLCGRPELNSCVLALTWPQRQLLQAVGGVNQKEKLNKMTAGMYPLNQ